MNTEELLVHHSGERKTAEGFHAGFVDGLAVLVFAFELEREVVGEMTALVVSSKEKDGIGVVDLEGPEVEDTLRENGRREVSLEVELRGERATNLDGEVSSICKSETMMISLDAGVGMREEI